MARLNQKTRSANRIVVKFDGVQVGLVQDLRGSDDYGLDPASGIGDIHAQEFVPTMARHNISASNMVLNSGTLRDLGIVPQNGDDALAGLEFDLIIQDRDTGAELKKYVGCVFGSGDVSIQKHAIVVNSAQFMARDVVGTGL